MAVKLYMNHHVPKAITLGLRLRKIDVLTAFEDGTSQLDDSALLDRAGELGRVLFSQDDDLIAEATKRQRNNIFFHGVIYAHQQHVSIGTCILDLEILCKAGEAEDFINRVYYLPL